MRRYQSRWSGLTGFITPESADSTGNGNEDAAVELTRLAIVPAAGWRTPRGR